MSIPYSSNPALVSFIFNMLNIPQNNQIAGKKTHNWSMHGSHVSAMDCFGAYSKQTQGRKYNVCIMDPHVRAGECSVPCSKQTHRNILTVGQCMDPLSEQRIAPVPFRRNPRDRTHPRTPIQLVGALF